jgi:hypothetical protein
LSNSSRSIWAFINRVVRSHLGHVLLAVSWTFILLVFVGPHLYQPQFVDCVPGKDEFVAIVDHFYPIWITALGVAHLPAILFTQGVTKLLQAMLSLSCGPTAKVEMPFLFGFSAIQWLLVGYIIESLIRRARSSRRRTQQAVVADR